MPAAKTAQKPAKRTATGRWIRVYLPVDANAKLHAIQAAMQQGPAVAVVQAIQDAGPTACARNFLQDQMDQLG